MKNLNLPICILLLLTVTSCAQKSIMGSTASSNFNIHKQGDSKETWSRLQVFPSQKIALDYALDRRLSLQRFHQLRSEPYFGTPAQKNCENNINIKGEIFPANRGTFFVIKVMANEVYALGDCLRENNTRDVYYEFLICNDGSLVEFRHYRPFDSEAPTFPTRGCS